MTPRSTSGDPDYEALETAIRDMLAARRERDELREWAARAAAWIGAFGPTRDPDNDALPSGKRALLDDYSRVKR